MLAGSALDMLRSHGQTVIEVVGEPGIGKWWLLREVVGMSAERGPDTFFYHDHYGTAVRAAMDPATGLPDDETAVRFIVNGEFIARPDDQLLHAYQAGCGNEGHEELAPDHVLFRRRDGRHFLVPRVTKQCLAVFREPITLAQARERLWLLGRSATTQLFLDLVSRRFVRQVIE